MRTTITPKKARELLKLNVRRSFLLASFLVSLFAAGLVWHNEALRWTALPFVAWALAVTPALIWGARE